MSSDDTLKLRLLSDALHAIEVTRYAELASAMIIVYDHLITLGPEIELIWKSHWSFGKVLFIINRYYGLSTVIVNNYGLFAPTLTDSFCLRFFQWQGWTGLIACIIAEIILQMRLYALYVLDKRILLLMSTCFVLASTASATILGVVLAKVKVSPVHLSPDSVVCAPSNNPGFFYLFWLPTILFESLLCVLAMYQGFRTFKRGGDLFVTGRRLVGILIRDSIFYFVVMFTTYLTNLLVWVAAPQNLLEVPIGFAVAFSCVLSNRLILNVRRESRELGNTRQQISDAAAGIGSPHSLSYPQQLSSPVTDKQIRYPDRVFAYDEIPNTPRSVDTFASSVFYPTSTGVARSLSEIEMNELRTMRDETWSEHSHPGVVMGVAI